MQRKIVTALFCDVSGWTALGESVDPEALQVVLARYFERMKAIVESHEGTVEKFIGDAVMAVFRVPIAHEDDGHRRRCRVAHAVEFVASTSASVPFWRLPSGSRRPLPPLNGRMTPGDLAALELDRHLLQLVSSHCPFPRTTVLRLAPPGSETSQQHRLPRHTSGARRCGFAGRGSPTTERAALTLLPAERADPFASRSPVGTQISGP